MKKILYAQENKYVQAWIVNDGNMFRWFGQNPAVNAGNGTLTKTFEEAKKSVDSYYERMTAAYTVNRPIEELKD